MAAAKCSATMGGGFRKNRGGGFDDFIVRIREVGPHGGVLLAFAEKCGDQGDGLLVGFELAESVVEGAADFGCGFDVVNRFRLRKRCP